MLNKELPFRYPASLYAKKVQANVTLRVFIDKEGQVVAESTHVAENSSIPSLDSAAVRGSSELSFIPAKLAGKLFRSRFSFLFTSDIPGRRRFRAIRFSRRQAYRRLQLRNRHLLPQLQ